MSATLGEGLDIDIYTCEVCLENMLDKDPRLLSCHHSFCINCLKQVMTNSLISCPICREKTTVPNSDIYSLKVNFMLAKIKDHVDKMYHSNNKLLLCRICLTGKATLRCQECSQVMCEECSQKHEQLNIFRNHKILKLCEKHKDAVITRICIKCVKLTCVMCVMAEHANHESEIETFQKGINIIKQQISEYKEGIDAEFKRIKNFKEENKKEMIHTKTAISEVKDITDTNTDKEKPDEQVLETLKNSLEKLEERSQAYEMMVNEGKHLKSQLNSVSTDVSRGDLTRYIAVKNKVEKLLKLWPEQEKVRIHEDLHYSNRQVNKITGIRSISKELEKYLEIPELEKTIYCTEGIQWRTPYNISNMDGTDGVLVSDWSKACVTMVYRSETSPVIIEAKYGDIRASSVYDKLLVTAYTDCITLRTFTSSRVGAEVKYSPQINDICSMVVVHDNCLILVSRSEQRIVEYNPGTNQTKIAISNLHEPVQVSMKTQGRTLFLVTCRGNTHRINVYNNQWTMLFTFGGWGNGDGQLLNPWGSTCTSKGILVSDMSNHRICQFSFEGEYINDILTSKDGISYPVGIIYIKPCVWVTSHSPPCVKCFKLCE